MRDCHNHHTITPLNIVSVSHVQKIRLTFTGNIIFISRETSQGDVEGAKESGWDRVKALFDLRFVSLYRFITIMRTKTTL